VRDFFNEKGGKVTGVRFNMKDGVRQGFAHVDFETPEQAKAALGNC